MWTGLSRIPVQQARRIISAESAGDAAGSRVLDDHRAGTERGVVRSQNLKHPRGNGLGRLISHPDQNHARDRTATGGQEATKCTTSSPASRNARTVAIELPMSARSFTPLGSRMGEPPRWLKPKRRTALRVHPRVPDPDIPERSRRETFHWRRGYHERNGNPHASDTGAPSHYVGVKGDSGEHRDNPVLV